MAVPAPKPPWQEKKREVWCRFCGLCALILPSMRYWPTCCGKSMQPKVEEQK